MNPGGKSWRVWWYAAIALGFVLLAVVHMISGDKPWPIAVRLLLAAGFAVLAYMESAGKTRRKL